MKVSLLIFLVFAFGCNQNLPEKNKEKVIGKWVNRNNVKVEFTSDGFYEKVYPNFSNLTKGLVMINGKLEEVDFGPLKYSLKQVQTDYFDLKLIGSKNGLEFSKQTIIIKDENLLCISYKSLPGIENHIDEISWYVKEGKKFKLVKTGKTEKIIIPDGFHKNIFIAYNQSEGQELIQDTEGNRILNIPESGLLKTKFKEIPENMTFQNYEFYEKNNKTGKLSRMREFQHEDYRKVLRDLKESNGNLKLKYNPDSVAVFVLGFNQIGRGYIEREVFKEKIQGNILMINVDTISKVLKLNEY